MAIGGNTADSLSTTTKFTLGGASGAGTATATAAAKVGATVIGPEAVLRGDIKSKSDLVIAGSIEGEVSSESKIVIAQGGSVVGRLAAMEIVIEGRLAGDSTATKSLSILSSAQVRGDVSTPVIMIEPGATFVGRCSMTEQPE
ncbi:MAG: polymer-forming cytoskeletal protein [Pseudomonadota bacterium]